MTVKPPRFQRLSKYPQYSPAILTKQKRNRKNLASGSGESLISEKYSEIVYTEKILILLMHLSFVRTAVRLERKNQKYEAYLAEQLKEE